MSLSLRRASVLCTVLALSVLAAACGETSNAKLGTLSAPDAKPALRDALPEGCTTTQTCVGIPTSAVTTIETLRICKMYPVGTNNPPAATIKLDVRVAPPATSPTSLTYTVQPNTCLQVWGNALIVGPDTVTVQEIVPPGYTATSQVMHIVRPGLNGTPVFRTTDDPTTATTITGIVGGPGVPGITIIFTNTPVPINEQSVPIANGPYTGVEGSGVSFSSAGTMDPDNDPLSFTWDFGDGITSTSANPVHTYADNGVYQVTLTVNDGHSVVTAHTTATISNVNPAPTATVASATLACGESASFTGGFTDAGIIDQNWTWSINWGDASAPTTGFNATMAAPITATHSYGTNTGPKTITLTVTDKDGGVGTATTTVTNNCAPNAPPTVVANGPYTGVEGSGVSFSSAGTVDGENDALTYLWDFGDGITSSSQNPVHTYADNGVYTVTLTVNDGHNPAVTVTTTATITNANPVPTASVASATLSCGQVAQFTGGFTDAGVIDFPWSWSISWGDGSPATTGTNSTMSALITATHSYGTNAGNFTITLTVTDKDGGSGSATTAATNTCVPNRPPVPVANGPYTGVEGSSVSFSSTGTADADNNTLTYAWTFGDGGTSTSPNPTHTYADNGVYPVTLTVSDGVAPPVTVNTTSTITNVNPVPTAAITAATTCGSLATFTGSFTDAGINDQTWTWSINWGDGSPVTTGSNATMSGAITATHSYGANNGSHTVTLSVTDKDGGTGTATATSVNSCAAPTAACPTIVAVKGVTIASATIAATGGAGAPYTYSASGLPAGLSINATTGVISGAPSAAGVYPYTVTFKDKIGTTGTLNCSVTVNGTPTASCVTINAIKGKAITAVTLTGTGGTGGAYTFSATGLPAGLYMSTSGTITGTPTAVAGTYTYTVTIKDKNNNVGTFTCTITVSLPDTTAPVCAVYANASPAYMTYQDGGSGIVKLDVTQNLNNNYALTITPIVSGTTYPTNAPTGTAITFAQGVTSLIKVSAVRKDTHLSAQLTVKATDGNGNTISCDPVETTVTRSKQDDGDQTFYDLPYEEHFVTIENGGLKSIDVIVNGTTFKVKRLADDEVRTIDVSSAMKHNNKNTITLSPKGKKGETADVTIGPTP